MSEVVSSTRTEEVKGRASDIKPRGMVDTINRTDTTEPSPVSSVQVKVLFAFNHISLYVEIMYCQMCCVLCNNYQYMKSWLHPGW